MTLYMTPPKLSLSSEPERSLPSAVTSTTQEGVTTGSHKKGNVLYKTLSPRKKFDKFGLDQTDYKAYCLSTTVFPTAVKTTLLGDLQDSNPHACGFDIVDRPTAGTTISLPSCATSVINAPPPTAVTSQRSTQSAPVVAFVEVPFGDMLSGATRRSSALTRGSKSTANSQVFTDVSDQEHPNNINEADGEYIDPVTSQNHSGTINVDVTVKRRTVSQPDPRCSWSSEDGNGITGIPNNRSPNKRSDLPGKTSGKRQTSSKVASYSRFDESRLIRYQWKSREIRQEEDKKDGGDIRDTMYLNTFCPKERPVRFNKISLPRIGGIPRQRPWTVSESKFNARSAVLMTKSPNNIHRQDRTPPTTTQSHQAPLRGVLKHSTGGGGVTKSAGHIKLRQTSAWKESAVIEANKVENYDDDGDKENDNGGLKTRPLLEIRSFLSSNALGDQREKLKGKNGCLNSRVKQCVRFVRYRERLDKHEENRPLKSEHGKYRPFSKTDVREHNMSNPAPSPELKLQQSVETYQQYVENIARQTHLSSPKPNFSFKSGSNPTSGFSRLRAPKPIGSPHPDMTDSTVVQSVMDSNRPDINLLDTPRPQNSAIYTKDVSDMGQALDIKRISPVPTVNRVVPGTRGVIQRSMSPRVVSASSDENGDDVVHLTPTSSAHHGDTIVVPMAFKSECPSEYSVTKDD